MEVILLQNIEKVGEKHEIVKVKDGYGRNFLIPKGMAILANKENRSRLDDMKRKETELEAQRVGEYQAIAEKLTGQVLKIGAKAGTTNKIFGSVTNVQLASAIKEQLGLDIERRHIIIPEEVKTLGTYTAIIDLYKDIQPEIRFEVVAE